MWDPGILSPALWLDANDSSTLTLDDSTVPNVIEWRDKSAFGRHATQNASYGAPSFTPIGLDGYPGVRFALNEVLSFQALPITDDMNVLVIFTRQPSTATVPLGSTTAFGPFAIHWYDSDFIRSGLRTSQNVGTVGQTGAVVLSIQRNSTEADFCLDGASQILLPSTSAATSLNALGTRDGTVFTDGVVSEIVVVSGDSTLDSRQKLEGYAAHKWGLASNLPSDHPYKAAPPPPPPAEARALVPPPVSPKAYAVVYSPSAMVSVPSPIGGPAAYLFGSGVTSTPFLSSISYRAELFNNNGFDFHFIDLPISSWQSTLQAGERSSYLQVVVPAADQYMDEVNFLTGPVFSDPAEIRVYEKRTYSDGLSREVEMGRVQLQEKSLQKGPQRSSLTLSGYGRLKFSASGSGGRLVELPGAQTVSVNNGIRVRCEVDWRIKPGSAVWADGFAFVVSYINFYVNENQRFMDVGERPL